MKTNVVRSIVLAATALAVMSVTSAQAQSLAAMPAASLVPSLTGFTIGKLYAAIPEPSALALFGVGLCGIALRRNRNRT